MSAPATVAVIGAGIAGAACARVLAGAGVEVDILDRGRSPGGRMSSPVVNGRAVDLGASYFTSRDEGFLAVAEGWRARGLAHHWTDAFHVAGPQGLGQRKEGPVRWGAGGGLRSLVADLLAGLDVRRSEVQRVGPGPVVDGRSYDAVALAMPDPQAHRLLDPELEAECTAVADREWEPVLAVAAGWAERSWQPSFDGCFVEGSEQLGWIADDGRRRSDGAPVLVGHSTAGYAALRLTDPAAATDELVDAVRAVLGVQGAPAWTRLQRWTYARPTQPREAACFLGPAKVGLCGDGWGSPRVETAWTSGDALGRALCEQLA